MTRSIQLGVTAAGLALCCCGAASLTSPSRGESAVQITASPDPVASGGTLTYTIRTAAGQGSASQLSIHLPPGATDARSAGAGWSCEPAEVPADAFQASVHTDLSCASAAAMAGAPALTVTLGSPAVSGTIRGCAVARREAEAAACVATTVLP